MALLIDACAERSSSRTFFSTLFSIAEHSSRASDNSVSIFVNSVTAFGDFFFVFIIAPCSNTLSQNTELHKRCHSCLPRRAHGTKSFGLRQNHSDALLGQQINLSGTLTQ